MSSFFSRKSVCKLLASILAGTMCAGGMSFASKVSEEEVGVQADLPSSSDADAASSKRASRSKRNGRRKDKGGSKSGKSKRKSGAKSSGKSGVAKPKFVAFSEFEALKNRVASLESERGSSKWITAMKVLGIAMAVNRGVQFVTSADIVDWVVAIIAPAHKADALDALKDVSSLRGWLLRVKALIPIPFLREYELLVKYIGN